MLGVQNVGAVSVIKADGAMIGEALQECRKSLEDCMGRRRFQIVLEMSNCPLVNSESLEFIVDAQEDCLGRGGKLVLAEPQSLCREVLEITGIDERIAVFDDLRSALTDFAR
ncbi:STAS domain-containing protein [Aureliella helgolandensis]|uniref:STAS domain protein n=1 Tax=Aureliella helgolandensis TaxID=2527968 RepID=A0A518GHW9_9BACT|nr:STAS domain-containing protein [Aureliella helgolandensis]QDV28130.1 STAS domain protein [Aureliella helgolandensis]